jgi:DNA primase
MNRTAAGRGARAADLLDESPSSWVKHRDRRAFTSSFLSTALEDRRRRRFAHTAGAVLVARDPEHLTQEFSKADRGGRILVDTGRNGYSATFAAVYAVRARPNAPVSAPCTWEEIERGDVGPRTFTLRTMHERLARVGDLWSEMRRRGKPLRRAAERLRGLTSASPR